MVGLLFLQIPCAIAFVNVAIVQRERGIKNVNLIVTYVRPFFIAKCAYESRHIPKQNGFLWSANRKEWYTQSFENAAKLSPYCDEKAKIELSRYFISVKPWLGGISHPGNVMPFPFQIKAAEWMLSRNRAYLAADPGLGKTIIAALMVNSLPRQKTAYVCPPFLVANTENEFEKWCLKYRDVHIIPDTMLEKVAGYFDLLFIDEAHRFKNPSAKRTQALFKKLVPFASRVYPMSGTAMPNRPMELYTVAKHLAPETIDFMNQFEFGMKYCAGYKRTIGPKQIWDFSGASNMEYLGKRLKEKFMLRIKKEDVLPELPPKQEEIVVLSDNLPSKIGKLEKVLLKQYSPEDLLSAQFGDPHVSTYRRYIGEAKCNLASEFIEDILETTEESVLVFAHHVSVIQELKECLKRFDPIVVTGDVMPKNRQALVDQFQKDFFRRVFIGNIQAAGIGFTLTRATRVLFVEYSWVPAENEQASDRAHRIGQTNRVLVQYLIYKNSLDGTVMETILRKRTNINHI